MMGEDEEAAMLADVIGLFEDTVVKDDTLWYGPLALTTAPKVCTCDT
jgi:hypothetical protein